MSPRKLPPALARRDAAAARAKLARLREAAAADVALILRRKAEISEAFFDIGEALGRLKPPAAWRALGRRSFAELCETDLGLSATRAAELLDIVALVPRDTAVLLGQERAGAISEILKALPPKTPADARARLARGKAATLPGAGAARVDPARATVDALRDVAKSLRHTTAPRARRGRSTTPEERTVAAGAQRLLRAAGLRDAVVEALATLPGKPAHARITQVPVERLGALGRALAKL
jgi:hypothetical protein